MKIAEITVEYRPRSSKIDGYTVHLTEKGMEVLHWWLGNGTVPKDLLKALREAGVLPK